MGGNQHLSSIQRLGYVPAVLLNQNGLGTVDHLDEDLFDNWWSAGSLDWLNNLPDDFDQQHAHGT